jgi:hypothetical protein
MTFGKAGIAVCVALSSTFATLAGAEPVGTPAGYHPETRIRYGPLIGGGITTGIGGLMLVSGIDQRNHRSSHGEPGSGGEFLIIPGIVSLAVGVPLLAYGLLSRKDVYVRDSGSRVQVGFALDRQHAAVGLSYIF